MPLEVVTHQVDGKLAAAEAIVCPLTTFKCGQTVLDLTYVRPSSSGRACKKTFFFFWLWPTVVQPDGSCTPVPSSAGVYSLLPMLLLYTWDIA